MAPVLVRLETDEPTTTSTVAASHHGEHIKQLLDVLERRVDEFGGGIGLGVVYQ